MMRLFSGLRKGWAGGRTPVFSVYLMISSLEKSSKCQEKKNEKAREWPRPALTIFLALVYSPGRGTHWCQTLAYVLRLRSWQDRAWFLCQGRRTPGVCEAQSRPKQLWSLVFCSELCTAASGRLIWAPRTFPEACSDGKHSSPWQRQKPKTQKIPTLLKLMTWHHGMKSNLMREISQWEIHQRYNQQVFTEASRAQACAGRGRILVTRVPGLGELSFCLDDEDTLT